MQHTSPISIGWFMRISTTKQKVPTGAIANFFVLAPKKLGRVSVRESSNATVRCQSDDSCCRQASMAHSWRQNGR